MRAPFVSPPTKLVGRWLRWSCFSAANLSSSENLSRFLARLELVGDNEIKKRPQQQRKHKHKKTNQMLANEDTVPSEVKFRREKVPWEMPPTKARGPRAREADGMAKKLCRP